MSNPTERAEEETFRSLLQLEAFFLVFFVSVKYHSAFLWSFIGLNSVLLRRRQEGVIPGDRAQSFMYNLHIVRQHVSYRLLQLVGDF